MVSYPMGSDWRLFNCIETGKTGETGSSERLLADGLFESTLKERPETTLAGACLGTIRDFVDPLPEEDTYFDSAKKLARAQNNDLAAHFMADTVAIVPKYKAVTGGLARATLLYDPHAGISDNLGGFSKNFLEGAALNKIGKSMLPGSSMQNFAAARLGKGLMAESFTHLSAGFGFGAVKTGFAPTTWYDESGAFNATGGARSVLEGGLFGASVNLPAGLLGMRVAKGSVSLLAESRISQRGATMIAGMSSGYTGGAVFGAVDARMRGLNFEESLANMHFAGKAGAATGLFVSSFDYGKMLAPYREIPDLRARAQQLRAAERIISEESSIGLAKNAEASGISSRRLPEMGPGDNLPPSRRINLVGQDKNGALAPEAYEALKLDNPIIARDALSARIKSAGKDNVGLYRVHDNAPDTFSSWDNFLSHTSPRMVPVRVFEIEGHSAKLLVKESYCRLQQRAQRMDRLSKNEVPYDKLPDDVRRQISSEWSTSGDRLGLLMKHMSPSEARQSMPVVDARIELSKGALSKVISMEAFVAALDQLPNRSLVKSVLIMDEPSPQQAWSRISLKDPTHVTQADASESGRITYYVQTDSKISQRAFFDVMRHEWSHLADYASPLENELFALAARVDKYVPRRDASQAGGAKPEPVADGAMPLDKYYLRKYATSNEAENWAVHMGEQFLAPDVDSFLVLGQEAPVRTSILARALTRSLASQSASGHSENNSALNNRLQFVQENVLPRAVNLLESNLSTGSLADKATSAELLGYLGHPRHNMAALKTLAASESAVLVPKDTPVASRRGLASWDSPAGSGERTLGDIAFDAMLRMHARSRSEQIDFLVAEGRPGSPTRAMALNRLEALPDGSGMPYAKFLNMAGRPDKALDMIPLIREMPDINGKELVFNEVLSLGRNNVDVRARLARESLVYQPSLRDRAMELVPIRPDSAIERALGRLSRQQYNRSQAERAADLLGKIKLESRLQESTRLLRSENEADMMQGLEHLSGTRDIRSVKPLLETFARGTEPVKARASTLLGEFSPSLVKFYARELGAKGVKVDWRVLSKATEKPN